jgi:putative ABC transport system permease protein
LVGCLLGLATVKTILRGTTGTSNANTFAEILFNFEITPQLLITGMVFAISIGLFGGFFPAARAARLKIINALRET